MSAETETNSQPTTSEGLRDRLERFSMPEPNSGCHLWLMAVVQGGYGAMRWRGRTMRAHRLSWEDRNGPIPRGMHVCHKCDVPACINPDHLFLGTDADNAADRESKKRGGNRRPKNPRRGECHPRSKLTADAVRAIRMDRRPQRAIAASYGVAQSLIGRVKSGQSWSPIAEMNR